MKIANIINYYRSLSKQEFLNNVEEYKNMSPNEINILFLNINKELKLLLLDNKELFNLVMQIPENRNKKTILNLVDEEILDHILNSKFLKLVKKFILFKIYKINSLKVIKCQMKLL